MSGHAQGPIERIEVNGLSLRPPGLGSVVGIPSTMAALAYIGVAAIGAQAAALLAALVVGLGTLVGMWLLRVAMVSKIRHEMYSDTVVVRERR
ncbi:MAG: hypothetical protein FJ255_08830 [Phycisphaerae bacterium]|nr:hypothetical protein [Phycisphaerae bacterium]